MASWGQKLIIQHNGETAALPLLALILQTPKVIQGRATVRNFTAHAKGSKQAESRSMALLLPHHY